MSKIEWTDETWNPVLGCSKVSPGCQNCYAVTMSHRVESMGNPNYTGLTVKHPNGQRDWSGKVVCLEDRLAIPLKWKKPRRIFVNSMSDLFHEDVPESFIRAVFSVCASARQHKFQILTKRPERMREILDRIKYDMLAIRPGYGAKLPNVWLGTSVENQQTADERIPHLLQTPAAVRFLSCEPLLGPVDLRPSWLNPTRQNNNPISWVIVGGESGPKARPMHPDWARSLRDQCQAANVPFFFKQWGEWGLNTTKAIAILSRSRSNQLYVVVSETKSEKPIAYYAYPQNGTDEIGGIETMSRVGKAQAGRQLDGQEHNEYPNT